MKPLITGIATCKGRLEHVKVTAQRFIDSSPDNVHYVLSDFGCPENSGQWVIDNLGQTGRAHAVITKPSTPLFHKTIAANAGGRYAMGVLDTEYLMFIDADTIIKPGIFEKIIPMLNKERFIFADPFNTDPDLTGLIILHNSLFRECGGFEESFRDWGAEDTEFRLRLYAKHKRQFDVINGDFLGCIPHSDATRSKFYSEKNIEISNSKNFNKMRRLFFLYRKEDLKRWKHMDDAQEISYLLSLFDYHPTQMKPRSKGITKDLDNVKEFI